MVILCCLSFHCGGNEADHSRTLRVGVVVADMLRWAKFFKDNAVYGSHIVLLQIKQGLKDKNLIDFYSCWSSSEGDCGE